MLRYFFIILLTFVYATTSPLSVWSQEFPAALGWGNNHPFAKAGIQVNGKVITYSSPAVADIDPAAQNGKEVIIATEDGTLQALSARGELLWRILLPNVSCSSPGRGNKTLSTPAIGDLDGDGTPSVVIGYGGIATRGCDGGVAAYRADTGALEWIFSLKAFSERERFGTRSYTVFSTPALADTDNDGRLEIGFGSFDRNVYLLEYDGSVRWYYNAADTVWSSGAFADVDGDGILELIIGTDITGNRRLKPITRDGGYVYAFRTQKPQGSSKKNKRIGFRNSTAYLWQQWFDQVMFSSPVVADVLPSHPGDEIIIVSGCYFPERSTQKRGKSVSVLSARTGALLRSLPIAACSPSSVAVADLNRDGLSDIVVSVNGHSAVGGPGRSSLVAITPETGQELWNIIPRERGGNDAYGGHFTSPIVADIDRNGSLEVLVANRAAVGIFSGRTGQALTCQDASCNVSLATAYTASTLRATPSVDDLNGDGTYELIIGGGHSRSRGRGFVYVWSGFEQLLGSEREESLIGELPWPTARGTVTRQGAL